MIRRAALALCWVAAAVTPLVVPIVLPIVILAPRPAHAEDAATHAARKAFDKGEKLFALGRFAEALTQYQQAFDAKPIPAFLFNIGQCHRNLADYDAAIFSFKKYLRLDPDAPNREAVLALIDELEDQQAHATARREVRGGPVVEPPVDGRPIYKAWWFWTGVAVVVGGGATYALTRSPGAPTSDLGNIVFGK
jgi:tetratricopeptide (TPR) repeat protein